MEKELLSLINTYRTMGGKKPIKDEMELMKEMYEEKFKPIIKYGEAGTEDYYLAFP